jgi:hypothetical protein
LRKALSAARRSRFARSSKCSNEHGTEVTVQARKVLPGLGLG